MPHPRLGGQEAQFCVLPRPARCMLRVEVRRGVIRVCFSEATHCKPFFDGPFSIHVQTTSFIKCDLSSPIPVQCNRALAELCANKDIAKPFSANAVVRLWECPDPFDEAPQHHRLRLYSTMRNTITSSCCASSTGRPSVRSPWAGSRRSQNRRLQD